MDQLTPAQAATDREGAQPGDVVMLFRIHDEGADTPPPLVTQHAILAALRQAGLLPTTDPRRDARHLADFKERARLRKPQARRYGASGWNR